MRMRERVCIVNILTSCRINSHSDINLHTVSKQDTKTYQSSITPEERSKLDARNAMVETGEPRVGVHDSRIRYSNTLSML